MSDFRFIPVFMGRDAAAGGKLSTSLARSGWFRGCGTLCVGSNDISGDSCFEPCYLKLDYEQENENK